MNVLIVDSHPVYIEGLTVVLKRIDPDCRTISANSLNTGLSTLDSTHTTIDLLILGINTQSIDEVDRLRNLASPDSEFAIVVLCATNNCMQFKMLMEIGVNGVVSKYCSPGEMIVAFRECCSGRAYIPHEAQKEITRLEKLESRRKRVTSMLHLTKRQLQVLGFMEVKMSNSEIAEKLSVCLATIKTHINKLYSALDVSSRKECIQRSYDLGVLYHRENNIM